MQALWDGTRQDLPDNSFLGHQIAMAQQAFAAGWEHQQVADLLIAHRRAHAYSPGTLDEYQRLLAVALQRRKRRAAHDMFEHKDLHDQLTREEFHGSLATILGCDVVRLAREGVENASYSVQLNGHLIPIGGVSHFMSQKFWCGLLVNHGFRPLDPMKASAWNNVIDVMLALMEQHDNHDTTTEALILASVRQYVLTEKRTLSYYSLQNNFPFVDEGEVLGLSFVHFREWLSLRSRDGRALDRGTLAAGLRGMGITPRKNGISMREGTQVINRRYWCGPAELLTEENEEL